MHGRMHLPYKCLHFLFLLLLLTHALIAWDRQQAVLFKGKQLGAAESLSGAGVAEGDTLNVVPTKGEGQGAGANKARPVSKLIGGALWG